MPFEVQQEMTRSKLNIAPHIWWGYDTETRAKCIATEIISSRLKSVEEFERELDSNRRSNLNSE